VKRALPLRADRKSSTLDARPHEEFCMTVTSAGVAAAALLALVAAVTTGDMMLYGIAAAALLWAEAIHGPQPGIFTPARRADPG